MSLDPTTIVVIGVMTIAAASLRFGGFWFMRFVPVTPRVRAALEAMPFAVMLGLIVPPALRGGIAELAAIAVTGVVWRLGLSEVVAVVAGLATVAGLRAAGV